MGEVPTPTFSIRDVIASDEAFLWEMLTYAASMSGGQSEAIAEAKTNAYLRRYVEGWGSHPGDLGCVALGDASPLGAAWVRVGLGNHGSYGIDDETIPELAIATVPGARAIGVGGALLRSLISRVSQKYRGISLSVREENPAIRLYERMGFVVVRRVVNRVGGVSIAMLLKL